MKNPLEQVNTKKLSHRKGAWTPQEDAKLAEAISVHGAKRWDSIAARAGIHISLLFPFHIYIYITFGLLRVAFFFGYIRVAF